MTRSEVHIDVDTLETLIERGWRIGDLEDRRAYCAGYWATAPDGEPTIIYVEDGTGIVVHMRG